MEQPIEHSPPEVEREARRSEPGDTIYYQEVEPGSTAENFAFLEGKKEFPITLKNKWRNPGLIHQYGSGHAEGDIFAVEFPNQGHKTGTATTRYFRLNRLYKQGS